MVGVTAAIATSVGDTTISCLGATFRDCWTSIVSGSVSGIDGNSRLTSSDLAAVAVHSNDRLFWGASPNEKRPDISGEEGMAWHALRRLAAMHNWKFGENEDRGVQVAFWGAS